MRIIIIKEIKVRMINKIRKMRKVTVRGRLVIVGSGVLKLNLTPPSKFMLII